MERFCVSNSTTADDPIELPPGFRFHPSDEELITHYLSQKVVDTSFSPIAIGEVDLNKVEPWDLPWKAKMGEKEWYFFCVKDRKYPTGLRTNRATKAGYWKATGKDKEIFRAKSLVGMKKTLVFYRGRAPKGVKTNWVMHEYRLEGKHSNSMHNLNKSARNEYVICRIYMKTAGGKKVHISGLMSGSANSQSSDLPPLMEFSSNDNRLRTPTEASNETCFSNPMENSSQEMLLEEFTSSSSRNCDFSSFPFAFHHPNSAYSPQMIPRADSLSARDSAMMQDQSVFRLLLDNNVANMKTELSQGMCQGGFKPYQDQEIPVISTATIDLDCLWDY